jgi:hypothetical protein
LLSFAPPNLDTTGGLITRCVYLKAPKTLYEI